MTRAKIECIIRCMNEQAEATQGTLKFSSVADVAKVFNKTDATIRNWFNGGRFPNSYKVGITMMIRADDIETVRQAEIGKHKTQIESLQKSV